MVPDWQNRVEELVRSQSPSGLAMKKTDKIDIRLWPFKVLVEGHHAIAALRWPLAMAVALSRVVVTSRSGEMTACLNGPKWFANPN